MKKIMKKFLKVLLKINYFDKILISKIFLIYKNENYLQKLSN